MAQHAPGQLLALRIDDRRVGIASRLVREVIRRPVLTRVPHAPRAMLGLANVRGVAMPVLSLAELLGGTAGGERRLVVVDAGEPVALAVDAVAELLDAGDASVEPVDAVAMIAAAIVPQQGRARASAGTVADGEDAGEAATISLVTFAIGDQHFALPLDSVEEVLRLPADIAVLPHADAAVIGSTLVRGGLLPLLSLPALLAVPSRGLTSRSRVLAVRIGAHRVGLVVDAMEAVRRVAERDIDPVPAVLMRGDAEARIQAMCRLGEGRLVSVLAAEHLLREEVMAQLAQGERRGETATTEAEEDGASFLLFRVGDTAFGLPLGAVEEVATLPEKLTRLPRSPDFVQGVMTLRGVPLPVIDQTRRFGAAGASGARQRVLVVRGAGQRAGFLIDSVPELRRIPASALRPAPGMGGGDTRLFERVATAAGVGEVVLIVSPNALLDATERDLLAALAATEAPAP